MLRIGTNAIIPDELGRVLMVLRDDTRTWALPGGGLDLGELPTQAIIREVEEETGLKCLPVRLVGLYYLEIAGTQYLNLVFRCLVRGGIITPSKETPQVDYQHPDEISNRMLDISRERMERGLVHAGGKLYWGTQKVSGRLTLLARLWMPLVYTAFAIRRRFLGEPAYQPPPEWKMDVFTLIANEEGALLWVQRADDGRWYLPGGERVDGETPWAAAIRETQEETGLQVELDDLVGFYIKSAEKMVVLNFVATVVGGELLNEEAATFAYFNIGDEPENSLPTHVSRVAGWRENAGNSIPHMELSG